MKEYHKIQTMFKRDMTNSRHPIIEGDWTIPEFEYLKNNLWIFTEKVDGTNIRIMFDGVSGITFGGKTDNASIPTPLLNKLNSKFLTQIELFKSTFDSPTCFYGEGYGAKIQKGGGNYKLEQDFVLFDIRIGEFWLKREDCEEIGLKFGMDIVPIIGEGTLQDGIQIVKNNLISKWGNFEAEGIVAKPKIEFKTRNGERIITKIKSCDFKE